MCVCVCVLAALRAYLREGNCHVQPTSRGRRSPAPRHGVSGLRHTATRYVATVDALAGKIWESTDERVRFHGNSWRTELGNRHKNCVDEHIHRGTFLSCFSNRVHQWPSRAQLSEESHHYESILIRSSWRVSLQNVVHPCKEFNYSKVCESWVSFCLIRKNSFGCNSRTDDNT